jgi:hypothetical protein
VFVVAVVVAGCAGVKQMPVASGTAGSGGATGTGGRPIVVTGSGGSAVIPETCNGLCTDFPAEPRFDVGVSRDAAGMFGAPTGAAGPCITEPEEGTLFPNNWLRPRVRVPGSTGVIKITFHSPKQANDLVAYTNAESWAMPKDIWMALARHVVDEDISVTVQTPAGGASTVKFRIAPVGAGGSMVFWAADPAAAGKQIEKMAPAAIVNDSMLLGFTVGDESTVATLKITDVEQQMTHQDGPTQASHCIGCHTGTPDGDYVGFVDSWPWSAAFAGVRPDNTGDALPGFLGGSCTTWNQCATPRTYIQFPYNGPMTFTPARWGSSEKVAIIATQIKDIMQPWGSGGSPNWQPGRLAWVDLLSTASTMYNGMMIPTVGVAFDFLARTGDNNAAAFPTWSRDGNTIVYVSVACPQPGVQNQCGTQDGRLYKGAADLYQVPFNNRAGGPATPVAGASTAGNEEYYPAFSPDDRLLAFTRIPAGEEMYANPKAELYVVPFQSGAQAKRLMANDPPACSGKVSPGVNNHWPKWSPTRTTVGSRTYYWMIFSSNRYGIPPVTVRVEYNGTTKVVEVSQLYVTAVVMDEVSITTYPAIYLWNQPQNRLNTTPAWENFNIPIVVD